jgi:hypothetical protein
VFLETDSLLMVKVPKVFVPVVFFEPANGFVRNIQTCL